MERSHLSRREWLKNSSLLAAAAATGSVVGLWNDAPSNLAFAGEAKPAGVEVHDLRNRRELFVDQALVEKLTNVRLELQHPQPQGIVFRCDEPWEGNSSGYFRVIHDGGKYRMWYMCYHWPFEPSDKKPKHPFYVAYAESKDGVAWEKPNLGLYDFAGSKKNNLCCLDVVDNFTPFIDANPACPKESRYKAVGQHNGGLIAHHSPDGIHWQRLQQAPIITQGKFDSQNNVFWDPSIAKYRAYIRDFHNGVRDIRTCTSDDFKTWTTPELLHYQPGTPDEQLYTNHVARYDRAPHLYLGFPTRYVERNWSPTMRELPDVKHRELRSKVSQRIGTAITDGLFMASRDGKNFYRWGEAFLRPGPERHGTWVYGDCYPAFGLVETTSKLPGAPNVLSFYLPEDYWQQAAALRQFTLRVDGFVAARAPLSGGEILTKPGVVGGKHLSLNFATSAAGNLRVELQDLSGKPIPGFSLADADELFGDTLDRAARWKGSTDITSLAGRPLRVRFVLRDADLFSYQFA